MTTEQRLCAACWAGGGRATPATHDDYARRLSVDDDHPLAWCCRCASPNDPPLDGHQCGDGLDAARGIGLGLAIGLGVLGGVVFVASLAWS